MSLTGEPGRSAGEERPLARRPLRRLRRRRSRSWPASGARAATASAATATSRCSRPRCPSSCYVGTWAATEGCAAAAHAAVGAPVDRPLPGLPDRRRLDRRRLRQAEVLGAAVPRARPPGPRRRPALRRLRRARPRTATTLAADPRGDVPPSAPPPSGSTRSATPGVPCGPVNDVAQALADPQAARARRRRRLDHPRFGTVRQVASPLRVAADRSPRRRSARRCAASTPTRCCARCAATAPERVAELRRRGAFG